MFNGFCFCVHCDSYIHFKSQRVAIIRRAVRSSFIGTVVLLTVDRNPTFVDEFLVSTTSPLQSTVASLNICVVTDALTTIIK